MSHFFSKSTYISETEYFDFTEINFELQSTSNDNYLKTYDLNSPIINSQNTLSSKLALRAVMRILILIFLLKFMKI